MIVILDYKTGNIGSLLNMIKKIGGKVLVSSKTGDIEKAEKLILPGVGAFDKGMENLKNSGFLKVLQKKVKENRIPILGICLGMQLFGRKSEEGELEGLDWITEAETIKFHFQKQESSLKIPHMGWNEIIPEKKDPLLEGLDNMARFYFAHSYHLVCKNKENILATTNYGYDFPSIIKEDNIWGVQFHPEKSHKYGMRMLKNFIELC